MCAIFGFIAKADRSPRIETLAAIARGNIVRGPHAFGFAWIDDHGRLHCYKQTGRVTDHLGVLALARNARMLVGHLRYATHGDYTDNINNHPHPADGGWLVHNGVVHNYRDLVREKRLWPVSECDSEALGLLIERASGTLRERTAKAIKLTDGNLAMLGLWSRPATMIAARRGNPLHTAEASEGLYLATLASGLPGRPREVADNRVLQLTRWHGRVAARTTELPRREAVGSAWSCGEQGSLYRGG
jgi:glucosamine 6-phosphate synthetase-like amidotransferase/phosphosugar isomerase protein